MYKQTKLKRAYPYLMFAPALAVVAALAIYPVISLVIYSTRRWRLGVPLADAPFAGLENYQWLFFGTATGVLEATVRTLFFTVISIGVEVLIGLLIALVLNRKIIGGSFITAGLIIPIVITSSMVGMLWRMLYSENSLIPYLVTTLTGLKISWASPQWALTGVTLVSIWQYTPFFILTILAALQSVPVEIMEAAVVDGASRWAGFRYISLPSVWPVIRMSMILRLMYTMVTFEMIYAVFGGGPGSATEVLSYLVYRVTFVTGSIGKGSAIGVLMILATLLLLILFVRTLRQTHTQ
jgi:multiple sugar transport system permease protein